MQWLENTASAAAVDTIKQTYATHPSVRVYTNADAKQITYHVFLLRDILTEPNIEMERFIVVAETVFDATLCCQRKKSKIAHATHVSG